MALSSTNAPDPTLTPEEAYTALGHEVRIQVIETLNEAAGPLTFSELFDRLEYDTPSNLTYHLEQLLDVFVTKSDAGYSLTWTGKLVAKSAILAGQVATLSRLEPTEIDAECPLCGGTLEVSYFDNLMVVRCTDCVGIREYSPSGKVMVFPGPPLGLENRSIDAAFHAFAHMGLGQLALFARDVCPVCAATVERSVSICTSHEATEQHVCDACALRRCTSVRYKCQGCGFGISKLPASLAVLVDGSLDEAFAAHGLAHHRGWDAYALALAATEDLLDTDPVRLRLSLPVDDGPIDVTVDDDLGVLGYERTHQRPVLDG